MKFLFFLCGCALLWGWTCFGVAIYYMHRYNSCHFLPHTSEEVKTPPDFNTQPHDVKG